MRNAAKPECDSLDVQFAGQQPLKAALVAWDPTYRGRRHPILLREAESVSGARLREIGGALKAGVMCRKIPLDEALAGTCHGEKLAFSADEVLLVANRTTMSSV